jgi:transketolase
MDSDLAQLAKLVRYYSLTASTAAGSGHPTSSLSAADLMTVLFFKHLRYDLKNPENIHNDRVIFSKGHASPLFYALYTVAGALSEPELLKYRTFESPLEGHPTPRFKYTEAATGSLGQGLSIGVGEALALKKIQTRNPNFETNSNAQNQQPVSDFEIRISDFPKVYVLLGDGEMAEGSVWEALASAAYYKLNNLIAILDVNRLGQSGPTMIGADIDVYANRVAAFGWRVLKVPDGHDLGVIDRALTVAQDSLDSAGDKPTMIIAHTIKSKGISFLEDKEGWHGKALDNDELKKALTELGQVDTSLHGQISKPTEFTPKNTSKPAAVPAVTSYDVSKPVATRKAFGNALVQLGKMDRDLLVLDGDVKNSTYTETFKKEIPDQFLELFIAEQNMVGVAVGLTRLGFHPVVSSFACFLLRAADQFRMAAYSEATILVNGSHAGVSIGEDGPSQMGLEDMAFFRSVFGSTVVYPADAIATEKLVMELFLQKGIRYIRSTRPKTPIIYQPSETFPIGDSKTFSPVAKLSAGKIDVTVVAAGVTLHEALKAQKELAEKQIAISVIDCYSIKPIDQATLIDAAGKSKAIITVEDHYSEGGLGDAVLEALAEAPRVPIYKLAVSKMPRSGKPGELLDYEGISARAIVEKVNEIVTKG